MEALRLASASASQSLQIGLMRLLHNPVAANFLSVEQSTIRDYLAISESPTCLAVFSSPSSGRLWLIEMSRPLSFTFIDCLLGGRPTNSGPVPNRSYTEVETRLISKALNTILQAFSGERLRTDSLQVTQVVSDANLLAESTSNEAVALISFEIVCGPCQGLIQLCIPWKDVAQSSAVAQKDATTSGDRMRLAAAKVPVSVTARVARLKISTRDLAQLGPGDILVTDTDSTAEIHLDVDNREIFRGTPAQHHNHRVFLVTSAVLPHSAASVNSDQAARDDSKSETVKNSTGQQPTQPPQQTDQT